MLHKFVDILQGRPLVRNECRPGFLARPSSHVSARTSLRCSRTNWNPA